MSSTDVYTQEFEKLEEHFESNLSLANDQRFNQSSQREFENIPKNNLLSSPTSDYKLKLAPAQTDSPQPTSTNIIGPFQEILEKNNRTDEEARILYEHIKDFKFLDQLLRDRSDQESILRIVKALKYRKIKAGRPVFLEGDTANGNLYVLFTGELHIMKKSDSLVEAAETSFSSFKKLTTKVTFYSPPTKSIMMPNIINTEGSIDEEDESNWAEKKRLNLKRSRTKKITTIQKLESTYEAAMSTVLESPRLQSPKNKDELKPIGDSSLASPRDQLIRKLKKEKSMLSQEKEPVKETNPYGNFKDRIIRGEHFGEHNVDPEARMEHTVLANTDCELLVLAAATFNKLKNEFNIKVKKILDLIMVYLPGLELNPAKALVKENFFLFEEKEFLFGNHITNEGEKGDKFFIIYEGSCEVYRTIKIEESEPLPITDSKIKKTFFSQSYRVKEKIPLTILKNGMLAGEEILFSDQSCYNYSIQVVSNNCKLVSIKKDRFQMRFPKEVVKQVREAYDEKKAYKDNLLSQALEKRDIQQLDDNTDGHFLSVKRNPPQEMTYASSKINTSPPAFASYKKMISDNAAYDEFSTGNESPSLLPKLGKTKHNVSLEPDEIQLKQKILGFSRANLMPSKEKDKEKEKEKDNDKQKEKEKAKEASKAENKTEKKSAGKNSPEKKSLENKSPERKSPEVKLPYLVQLGNTDNIVIPEGSENPNGVDYIKKAKISLGYQDIKDVYNHMSEKLNLEEDYNQLKANINYAEYFKLDFGKPYVFEEKWLANAKSKMLKRERFQAMMANSVGSPLNGSPFMPGSQSSEFAGSVSPVNKLHSLLKDLDLDKCVPTKGNKSPSFKDAVSYQLPNQNIEDEGSGTLITLQTSTVTTSPKKFEPSFLKDFTSSKKKRREINKSVEDIIAVPKSISLPKPSKMRTYRSNVNSMKYEGEHQAFQEAEDGTHEEKTDDKRKNSLPLIQPVLSPSLPLLKGVFGKAKIKSKTIKQY